jgi:hypothetical protein
MKPILLPDIPFEIDSGAVLRALRMPRESDEAGAALALARQAQDIGRPKAMYGLAFVERRAEAGVTIDGVDFASRVLRVNLDSAQRVYPYIATCGLELERWAEAIADPLERFCAETIKQMVLGAAVAAFGRHLDALYSPGPTATMNPGSLADWPLSEQRRLFILCGDPQAAIGVSLTPSCLMVPTKSVSGIRFASQERYENCMLCPREDCPGRRMPYDAALYDRKYSQASSLACAECGATLTPEHALSGGHS